MDESGIEQGAGLRLTMEGFDSADLGGADPRLEAYERLIQQLDHSPLGTIEWDSDFRITRWSTRAREIFGWREEEVMDKHFNAFSFVHPEELSRVEAGAINLRRGNASHTIRQNRNLRRDGSTIHCEWYNSVLRDEEGKLCSVLSLVHEVTGREEAKLQARKSEERLALALGAARMGTWDWDLSSGRRYFDTHTALALGHAATDESCGPDFLNDRVHPEDLPRVRAAQEEYLRLGNSTYSVEYRLLTRDEGWRWFLDRGKVVQRDASGQPRRASGTLLDVSERRSLEEGLRQGQKMEALGTLAGGVAHEFNNILLAIFGYVELAVGEVANNRPALEHLEQVMSAAHRAETLVEQVLAFGRNGGIREEAVDISRVVRDARESLARDFSPLTSIRMQVSRGEVLVSGDERLLGRMLQNLLRNALESIQDESGTVSVELSVVELSRDQVAQTPGASPGHFARLVVRDTGCGMDASRLERACEPFFTTKATGAGTGLGLAVVHGIVRTHAGTIRISSQVAFGTTVEVLLPLLESEQASLTAVHDGRCEQAECDARILVVDDDDILADLSGRILRMAGYDVSVCTSAAAALEKLRGNTRFDLLFTDQRMPGQDGLELAEAAKALLPDLPVVLVSGNSPWDRPIQESELIAAVLSKPYGTDELSGTIRRVLAQRRAKKLPRLRPVQK